MFVSDDQGSEFEHDAGPEDSKRRRLDLTEKAIAQRSDKLVHAPQISSSDAWRKRRQTLSALDAYSRHKRLINEYLLYYPGATKDLKRDTRNDRTDADVVRHNSKFLWTEGEEPDTWEKKLAKKYYDKLFKEYCIADLSRFRENKVAMRWRVEKEVAEGKGQFICGEKRCNEREGLSSWEVNFSYMEEGQKKNALVKLRLCPECSYKLNYHQKRKAAEPKKRRRSFKVTAAADAVSDNLEQTSRESSSADAEGAQISEAKEAEIWSKPVTVEEERSKEEEFEDFLQDLLL